MGFLRLILALAVVADHSNTFPLLKFVGGQLAVECFLLFQGFIWQ